MLSSLLKSSERVCKSVVTAPGSTIFTFTPIAAISKLSPSREAFERELGTMLRVPGGNVILPPTDEMLTDDAVAVGTKDWQEGLGGLQQADDVRIKLTLLFSYSSHGD